MVKKISVIINFAIFYLFFTLPSFAAGINPCPDDASGNFDSLCSYNLTTLKNIVKNGITILFVVATIAALFFLVLGGIKWITSGGDKGKVEEARNWIVAAVVGLIITLSSFFILNIILGLFGLDSIGNLTIPKLIDP